MTAWLKRFLSRHCSTATMDRLVDPILTDIRIEAGSADRWASFWIRCAGLAASASACNPRMASVLEIPRLAFRRPPSAARTLAYSAAVTAAAVPLLMIPVLVRFPEYRGWPMARDLQNVLEGVTQVLSSAALPVGLFIGLTYGSGTQSVSLRPRAAVLVAATLCSIAAFVALSWACRS